MPVDPFAYEECCKRVPPTCEHWRAFDHQMDLARLHGEFMNQARSLLIEIAAYDKSITVQSLYDGLIMRMVNLRLRPHGVSDTEAEELARTTARETLGGIRRGRR